jgi:hypothetical protein
MKRIAMVTSLAVMAAMLFVGASDQGKRTGQQDVYFGFLLGSSRVAAVALDLAPPDRAGRRALRAYVCDGLGPPDGIAIWFKGLVEADEVSSAHPLRLASVGGHEELVISAFGDRGVYGSFSETSAKTAHFVAYPAIEGAGIYQVTLDQNLRYTGTSTDGARLEAQADTNGTTTGTIKPATGKQIPFTVHSLALASPAELSAHGLSLDYTKYVAFNQVPGSYVAVIAPGGSHWFGRSGSVQLGTPGAFIIGLDKKEFRR